MKNDLKHATIRLPRGHLHRVDNGRGTLLQCLGGTLWLTQQGDPRDIVLEAGEEAVIDRDGTSIVSALSDASFVLSGERRPHEMQLRARQAQAALAAH